MEVQVLIVLFNSGMQIRSTEECSKFKPIILHTKREKTRINK